MTLLEQLIALSCRYFACVRFVRVSRGGSLELRGFLGRLEEAGGHVAVALDAPDEATAAEKLQILFGDLLACFEGVGAVLEEHPETARDQALILARLLERGSVTFKTVHGGLCIWSPDMSGVPGPVVMVKRDEQTTLELLHSCETWLQVRWPKDLTS